MQEALFSLLSGILWLGNLEFEATPDDRVLVREGVALSNACRLLGLQPADLVAALTTKELHMRGEVTIHIARISNLVRSLHQNCCRMVMEYSGLGLGDGLTMRVASVHLHVGAAHGSGVYAGNGNVIQKLTSFSDMVFGRAGDREVVGYGGLQLCA